MLLLILDGTYAITGDIVRQVATNGRRFTPKQIRECGRDRERDRDQASCTKVPTRKGCEYIYSFI